MDDHARQVVQGTRFEFGKNWTRFLGLVDETRILEAEKSLTSLLEVQELKGKTFLDIGCGSGLFSLAAKRLGARVSSFDYDPHSVACTAELRRRYCPDNLEWTVDRGSVLDTTYLKSLGRFDVVYAWGVLHHTGAMWEAIENIAQLVREGGILFIAIYNDQGVISTYWRGVKWLYNSVPRLPQLAMEIGYFAFFSGVLFVADTVRLRDPFLRYKGIGRRGMGMYRDVVDWIGGYPFEIATPGAVIDALNRLGFMLCKVNTCGRKHGCNEFVAVKRSRNDVSAAVALPTSIRQATMG